MGIRDSRNTVSLPRWAATGGETLAGDSEEPPGPQKDTGWQAGIDVPVLNWFNWLHQQAYLFLAYLEILLGNVLTIPHLLRHQKGTTAFQVSAGAGLSVNVVGGQALIDDAKYEFASVTNLALAAADPTDPRFDLVALEVVGGVPAIVVVTGTPAASPAEPSLSAGQLQIARLRVNAAAVAPSSFVARRTFGAMAMDRFEADIRLVAGDMGGGAFLFDLDTELSPVLRLGEGGTTIIGTDLITIFDGATQIFIEPEAVQFPAPIRRKFDIPVAGFAERTDAERDNTFGGGAALKDTTALATAYAAVRVPNGATITAFRLYGYRVTNAPGFFGFLYSVEKGTGVQTAVGVIPTNAGSGSSGNFTQAVTGLAIAVDQSKTYEIFVNWDSSAGDLGLRGAEVEWEESKPWDGI
jgi:hypothetical protein